MTKVQKTNNFDVFSRVQEANSINALSQMAESVLQGAKLTAPRKTGNMRHSGDIQAENNGKKQTIVFGESGTLYALIQEQKQFKHYTTPGTGPHYLKNAGDAVAKRGIDIYLK